MIDRLDHVVIAVRDLDAASQSYREWLKASLAGV